MNLSDELLFPGSGTVNCLESGLNGHPPVRGRENRITDLSLEAADPEKDGTVADIPCRNRDYSGKYLARLITIILLSDGILFNYRNIIE